MGSSPKEDWGALVLCNRENLCVCPCVHASVCLRCLKPGLRGLKSGLKGLKSSVGSLKTGLKNLKPGIKSLKPGLRGFMTSLGSLIPGLGASNLAAVTCRQASVDCGLWGLCAVLAGL